MFETTVFPRRFPSPFFVADGEDKNRKLELLGNVPGSIGEPSDKTEGDKADGGMGRKRPKRNAASATPAPATANAATPGGTGAKTSDVTDRYGPSRGLYVGQAQPQATSQTQTQTQTQTAAQAQLTYAQQQAQYMMQQRSQDRSLTTGAGLTAYASTMVTEKLPPETSTSTLTLGLSKTNLFIISIYLSLLAQFFQRDPLTDEVLWFASPPVDMPRSTGPKYSLAYLHHLAKKRKREEESHPGPDGMNMDEDTRNGHQQNGSGNKKSKSEDRTEIVGRLTTTERLAGLLAEFSRDELGV